MHMALCPYEEDGFRSQEHGSSASAWFGRRVGPGRPVRPTPAKAATLLVRPFSSMPRPNQTRKVTRLLVLRTIRTCRAC